MFIFGLLTKLQCNLSSFKTPQRALEVCQTDFTLVQILKALRVSSPFAVV